MSDCSLLELKQELNEHISISYLLEQIQLLKPLAKDPITNEALVKCEAQLEIELKKIAPAVTSRDMSYFRPLKGLDVFDRLQPYYRWKQLSKEAGLWHWEKAS